MATAPYLEVLRGWTAHKARADALIVHVFALKVKRPRKTLKPEAVAIFYHNVYERYGTWNILLPNTHVPAIKWQRSFYLSKHNTGSREKKKRKKNYA